MNLTSIIEQLLSTNLGPDPADPPNRKRPSYGIHASIDDDTINVNLSFLAGAGYCCSEWDCHLGLREGRRWTRLRELLIEFGLEPKPQLRLQLNCVVEEGALFFNLSRPDPTHTLWYEFKASKAHEYQANSVEGTVGDSPELTPIRES